MTSSHHRGAVLDGLAMKNSTNSTCRRGSTRLEKGRRDYEAVFAYLKRLDAVTLLKTSHQRELPSDSENLRCKKAIIKGGSKTFCELSQAKGRHGAITCLPVLGNRAAQPSVDLSVCWFGKKESNLNF